MLAGTSRPVDRVVVEQALYQIALQERVDPSDAGKLPELTRAILKGFDEAKSGRSDPGAALDLSAWFREHAASDPSETIKRVRAPVIVLNGERDTLVLPYHAVELARAAAQAGNRRVSLRIFPNLTHLFTPSTLDASVQGERATEVSAEFLQTLQAWAADVLLKGAGAGAQKATP